jgi:subtilisin-like proprotein convertase family protein
MSNPVSALRDSTGLVTLLNAAETPQGHWALETVDTATQELLAPASTAVSFSFAVTTTSQILLPVNLVRKGVTVQNKHATSVVFLDCSTSASAAVYTVRIGPQAYYEAPYGYTGPLAVIGDAAGSITVTEFE